MNITRATELVTADQRRSFPEMSPEEAVAEARDTLGLLDSGPGWVELEDNGSELAAAYLIVLATPTEPKADTYGNQIVAEVGDFRITAGEFCWDLVSADDHLVCTSNLESAIRMARNATL